MSAHFEPIQWLLALMATALFCWALNGLRRSRPFRRGHWPRSVSKSQWSAWHQLPEKPVAILIHAWRRHAVLEHSVRLNIARSRYRNFRIFLGVHADDADTLAVAKSIETRHADCVTVVLVDGSSRPAALNRMMEVLSESVRIARAAGQGWLPESVGVFDAEDIWHPHALTALNAAPFDGLTQVPGLSLPVPVSCWLDGSYLGSFSQAQLQRFAGPRHLWMGTPGQGSGIFLSWSSLEKIQAKHGNWWDENQADAFVARLANSRVECRPLLVRDPQGRVLATRDYYPDALGRTIRPEAVRSERLQTAGPSLSLWSLAVLAALSVAYAQLDATPNMRAIQLLIISTASIHALQLMLRVGLEVGLHGHSLLSPRLRLARRSWAQNKMQLMTSRTASK